MYGRPESKSTRLISFSGIDGAGKSTQIQALYARLKEEGLDVMVLSFWDNVAAFKRIREGAGYLLFRGDRGVGTPSAPVNRRDKNVRSWPMTLVRLCLYILDAIVLRIVVNEALHVNLDVVIFDRYIFDELANLPLQNRAMRAYVALVLKLAPKPHVSFLIDADPDQARARKPEYPIEFLRMNRWSYLTLSDFTGGMTIVNSIAVCDVKQEVLRHAMKVLSIDNFRSHGKHDRSYPHRAAS